MQPHRVTYLIKKSYHSLAATRCQVPVTENSYMGWPLGMKGGQCYKSQVSSSLTKHLALYIVPGAMTVDVGGGRVFWGSSSSSSSSRSRSISSSSGRRQ